jgi:hypothetical protein
MNIEISILDAVWEDGPAWAILHSADVGINLGTLYSQLARSLGRVPTEGELAERIDSLALTEFVCAKYVFIHRGCNSDGSRLNGVSQYGCGTVRACALMEYENGYDKL